MPINTVTGFEIKPPKSNDTMWEITITRANNIDTIYSMAPEYVIRDFIKKAQAAIASGKGGENTKSSPTPSERIAVLKELLEDGVISQEAFKSKRSEIISEI
jgi:hypothetical protein